MLVAGFFAIHCHYRGLAHRLSLENNISPCPLKRDRYGAGVSLGKRLDLTKKLAMESML